MKKKENLIIETAIKLFSINGFDATSIQDIAEECGIAKGSFYSYFKSKDELLLETLSYYFSNIQNRVNEVNDMNLEPRDKFIKQLAYIFEGVFEHKQFIITLAYEQVILLNDSMKKALYEKQNKTRQFYREGLLSIYGENIKDYLWDLAIMLEGMFQAFIRMFIMIEEDLDIHALAGYIINRMDDLVNGLNHSGEQPILSDKEISHMSNLIGISLDSDKENINELLSKLKRELEKVKENGDYFVSLEVVEEELARENPREPVILGMLSNLEGLREVETYVKELKLLLKKASTS